MDNLPVLIFPTSIIKYTGKYYKRKEKFQVVIRYKLYKKYKLLDNEKDSFLYIQNKNIKHNLPIKNIIYDYGDADHLQVKLTQNQVMIFDREDIDIVQKYNLSAAKRSDSSGSYDAVTTKNGKTIKYCNILLKHKPTRFNSVDHIDHNPLINVKKNIRPVTQTIQNINRKIQSNNTSGIIGVYFDKKGDRWRATWCENGEEIKKSFSCLKWGGYELAKQKAIECRNEQIRLIDSYIIALCLEDNNLKDYSKKIIKQNKKTKSGIKGINLLRNGYRARWSKNKKRKSEFFSFSRYNNDKEKTLRKAIRYRNKKIKKIESYKKKLKLKNEIAIKKSNKKHSLNQNKRKRTDENEIIVLKKIKK